MPSRTKSLLSINLHEAQSNVHKYLQDFINPESASAILSDQIKAYAAPGLFNCKGCETLTSSELMQTRLDLAIFAASRRFEWSYPFKAFRALKEIIISVWAEEYKVNVIHSLSCILAGFESCGSCIFCWIAKNTTGDGRECNRLEILLFGYVQTAPAPKQSVTLA